MLFVLKRCLELAVLLGNQLELLYSPHKKIGAGPPFCKIFIIHPRKFFLNQNYVEFDLSIGHARVLFPFFLIINNKCTVDHVHPSTYPPKIHISIYFGHETLFLQNLMIIITGTFRNTSNFMK